MNKKARLIIESKTFQKNCKIGIRVLQGIFSLEIGSIILWNLL